MTDDRYEYFAVPDHNGGRRTEAFAHARRYGLTPTERETVNGVWRRKGDDWEYFSLLDRQWHQERTADHVAQLYAGGTNGPRAPGDKPGWRVPIDADQASALTADLHQFTRYWIEYVDGTPKQRVFRHVGTPEMHFRGYFSRHGYWTDSSAQLHDFLTNGPHVQPIMIELEPPAAEQLIQATLGITGTTQWWPQVDPGAARFVVSDTFALPDRGTLVTGRLEQGVVRPPVDIWWKASLGAHLPVLAVEFPTPGSTAPGEVTLLLDHPRIEFDPGTVLYTPPYTSKP